MFCKLTALSGLTVALLLGSAARLTAQVNYPQALQRQGTPSHPTLSPYLNLLRDDSSLNSPYHTYVLPRREVAQQQLNQAAHIRSLERSLDRVEPQRVSRVHTGTGGYFQKYLHFYSAAGRP